MKKVIVVAVVTLSAVGLHAQTTKKVTKPAPKPAAKTMATAAIRPLKSNNDSVSYAFGISLGEFLKSQGVTAISYPMLNLAISQTLKNQKTYMDVAQCNAVLSSMQNEKREKVVGAEKATGAKFLADNAKRSGVQTTASGLQYEVITKGTGPMPKLSDTIVAHYRGSLLDGKEFDNSYNRGEPLTIPVAGVIPGWTEALQLMPVGSKWKLYIPSDLAYGDYGAGGDIPGGATLVFEIELLSIK